MIRVYVVDDHPIVREGVVTLLEAEPDFELVGSAGTAEEALEQIEARRPDVILLDLELPGISGLQAIPSLLRRLPQLKIIVFTGYSTNQKIIDALSFGAVTYLLKGKASGDEIATAIRKVYQGEQTLDPDTASKLLRAYNADRNDGVSLSPREVEVLRRVAEGMPNKQIASVLNITEHTVKFHINSIFSKLGAENRAQAVAVANQKGLL